LPNGASKPLPRSRSRAKNVHSVRCGIWGQTQKRNGIQLPDAAPPSRVTAGEVAEEEDDDDDDNDDADETEDDGQGLKEGGVGGDICKGNASREDVVVCLRCECNSSYSNRNAKDARLSRSGLEFHHGSGAVKRGGQMA
jgi:hypothetical protein